MIVGLPETPKPYAPPDPRVRSALAGSAALAVSSLTLLWNNGARLNAAAIVTVLFSIAVPLGWSAIRRRSDANAFPVTTISFCAYAMLATDLLQFASGAILVGMRYFIPLSLLQTAAAVLLIVAHRMSRSDRAGSLAGLACAFVALVLESAYLLRFR